MGELLPQNKRDFSPLKPDWFNRVGRQVQSNSFFVPGSTMGGFRTGSFQADLPFPKTVVKPVVCLDTFRDANLPGFQMPANAVVSSFGESNEEVRIFTQDNNGRISIADTYAYKVSVLYARRDQLQVQSKAVSSEYLFEADFVPNRCENYSPGNFLIPRNPNNRSFDDESIQRQGEFITCAYDYRTGSFVPVAPIDVRHGTAIIDGDMSNFVVNVQIYAQPINGNLVATHTFVYNVRTEYLPHRIKRNDKLILALVDNIWYAVAFDASDKHQHIHFVLNVNLTAETESAYSTIEKVYEGREPSVTTVQVYNPIAGCTGTTYRFAASSGCRGQAIWSDNDQKYYIWQLDCESE